MKWKMNEKVKKALSPPDMGGDEIRQFQADFLAVVLQIGLIGLLFLAFVNFDTDTPPLPTLFFDLIFLASGLLHWHWLKQGKIRRVGLGVCIIGIPLLTSILASLGSVRNGVAPYFILFILIASVLFGLRGLISTVSLSSAIVFGLILAQKAGLLPVPNHAASFNQWQVLTTLFILAGWFAYFARSRTNSALKKKMEEVEERKRYALELQQAHDQLAAANRELARHRDHLEELVRDRTLELAAAREMAEIADRAKSAFLSAVSHEMKTPLNHISGMGYLLSSSADDEKSRKRVDTIVKAAGQLDRLISSILDYTRMESATLTLENRTFALGEVIETAESAVRDQAGEKRIAIGHLVDPDLPATFFGDPQRIAQVLEILLDNAVKFSNQGPVTVRVGLADGSSALRALRFEVEDHGPGFPIGRLEEFFTLFQQGESGLARRYGGTGMGLTFARRLVALMAGEISATSTEGEGSTFRFTIPIPAGQASAGIPSS
jgi:signal transduction histidine kinase